MLGVRSALGAMVALAWVTGCALVDGLAGSDGDEDGGSDSDVDTDVDTDTGEDLHDCFTVDRSEDLCEDQEDHSAECATRHEWYADAACDPIDQCGCVSPDGCFPAYDITVRATTDVECAAPGTAGVGEACSAHTDCAAGLFCLADIFSASGEAECAVPCDDACDCPDDEMCVGFYPPFCKAPELCDPLDQSSCPEDRACLLVPDIFGRTIATDCLGGLLRIPEGDPCDSLNACRPGLVCFDGTCHAICRLDGDCESGNCVPAEEAISGCEFHVGICL